VFCCSLIFIFLVCSFKELISDLGVPPIPESTELASILDIFTRLSTGMRLKTYQISTRNKKYSGEFNIASSRYKRKDCTIRKFRKCKR
jgi:hypothetical protein